MADLALLVLTFVFFASCFGLVALARALDKK